MATSDEIMIIDDKENSPSPKKHLKQAALKQSSASKQMSIFDWAKSNKSKPQDENSVSKPKPVETKPQPKKVLGAKNENVSRKSETEKSISKSVAKNEDATKSVAKIEDIPKSDGKKEDAPKSDEVMTIDDDNDNEIKIDENKTPKRKNSLFDYFCRKSEKKNEPDTNEKQKSETKQKQEIEPKVEMPKKPQLTITELIKKNGRQPFNDEANNSKLNNTHFGDLLQIVEQYNNAIPLFDDFLSRTEIGSKKIKYTSLVKSLQNDSHEAKIYYLDIIKRFLMIFIYHENVFPKGDFYQIDFTRLGLKSHLIQELTRITLNVLLSHPDFDDENSITTSGFDIIKPSQSLLDYFGVMKKLEINHSNEPFGDLNVGDKLDVLKIFCDQLFLSNTFRQSLKNREEELAKLKTRVNEQEEALALQLEITVQELRNNKDKYFNEIFESKNYNRKKVAYSITKNREKMQELKNESSSNLIKVPDFSDTKSNSYWRFSFIKELVVEIAQEDPNEPVEWYLLDFESTKQLIDDLQMKFEYREVRQKLLEVYKEQKPLFVPPKQEETKTEPERVRPMLVRAAKVLGELTASDGDESDEEEAPKQKKKRGARKDDGFKMPVLYSIKEIDSFESDYFYSIDEMALNLANLIRYMVHYGVIFENHYPQLKEKLVEFAKTADFEEKFKIMRYLLEEFYQNVQYRCKMHTFIYHPFRKVKYAGDISIQRLNKGVSLATKESQSVSQLYFLLYHFMANIMLFEDCEKQKCPKCHKLGKEFKKRIDNLNELMNENDEDDTNELHICYRCPSFYHIGCDVGHLAMNSWLCTACVKASPYEYQLIGGEPEQMENDLEILEQLQEEEEEEEEEVDDNPAKSKLRKTTKNSKINFEPYFNLKLMAKQKHDTSNSTNTSVSSNDSSAGLRRSTRSRNQRRNKRDSSVSSIDEEQPMRKSERTTTRKKVNYAIASDNDDF